jgi:hypothetical protein
MQAALWGRLLKMSAELAFENMVSKPNAAKFGALNGLQIFRAKK